MQERRLGCISGFGIIAALLTLLLTGGFVLARGGSLFAPGPLNAQTGVTTLGGVGSHAEIGGRCETCHTAPWASETLADRCLACHTTVASEMADPLSVHGALKVQRNAGGCRNCHTEHHGVATGLTVIDPATFPHTVTGYALSGHRTLSPGRPFTCADCHAQDLAHFDRTICDGCHRQADAAYMQAHTAAFGGACLDCHDGVDRYGRSSFDHGRVFPLTGQHATVDCAGCHASARSVADLQAAPKTCVACHQKDDKHNGQLGADCGACHKTDGWQPATFDHSKSAFPLTGKHLQVDCAKCHVNGVYRGAPQTCFACHQKDDTHNGQFGADCGACHKTEGWQPATFDHSKSAFPLTGKHLQVDCAKCHANNVFKGTPQTCVACHQKDDKHNGQFGADCGACHKTDAWQGAAFDHSKSAFPLTGKHVQVECIKCHANNVFKGTPQMCVACHQKDDKHQGQFGADCGACHKTDAWQGAAFDHSQSAFPLTGKHVQVECIKCHANNVFKGTPVACAGCHSDPAYHLGAFGAACADCHTAAAWSPARYTRPHTFPINHGESGVNACKTCHPAQVKAYTCYGCHQHTEARIASQHRGVAAADLPNCTKCHATGRGEGRGG